jgi:hypothetical protein
MNRVLVRLLLWFFIAALPLQGLAAVLRMCCDQTATASAPHDAVTPSVHAHCADMAAQPAPVAPSAAHGADHQPQPAGHDAAKVSSCATCGAVCLGAAMMPAGAPLPPRLTTPSSAVAIAPDVLLTGHIPAGLERPPRPLLA